MALTLLEHQNIGIPILKNMETVGKGGFLCDEMGMGKTILMAEFLRRNKVNRIKKGVVVGKYPDLLVCPMSLMKQWKRELKRVYKAFSGHKPKTLIFHGANRMEKLGLKKWDFVITTYSIIGSLQLNPFKWGRVVLDESHYIKNGIRSKKVKAAEGAYAVGLRSKFNWCITGTPFNNRMKDIASQCKFIGTVPYNDPKWWKDKTGGLCQEELDKWRNTFVLRRTKDDILLPSIYHDIDITPTLKEKLLVEKIRAKAQKKFEQWKRSKGLTKIRLQGQILGLIQRLRVVSNSYYCGEDINADKVVHECAKVNTMINMLDHSVMNSPTKSVIVFSQFTSYLDVLEKVIEDHLIGIEVTKFTGSMSSDDREEVVFDFTTDTHPRILLVSLMAGGCGLNLMPCSTVFLSEPYYNPFMEKQAEERVHRIGQDHQVHIYRFRMENSIETWINELKKKKLFLASGLDLVSDMTDVPTEFSFDHLNELFSDFVGFQKPGDENKTTPTVGHVVGGFSKKEEEKKEVVDFIGEDCSICLDDVGMRKSCNIACGHLYHDNCLTAWRQINDSCPMCKRQIQILV